MGGSFNVSKDWVEPCTAAGASCSPGLPPFSCIGNTSYPCTCHCPMQIAWNQFVQPEFQNPPQPKALWARFTPTFAPMGVEGKHWLLETRKLAKGYPEKFGIEMRIVGQACDGVDAM